MTPKLTYNCPEKWENMKLGLISHHCQACDKEIHDFTKLSKEEIILYLLQNRHKEVCGRINPSQLDYRHEELTIIIESLIKKHKNTNLAFFILAAGSLALISCENRTPQNPKSQTGQIDPMIWYHSDSCQGHKTQEKNDGVIIPPAIPVMGIIAVEPDTSENRMFAEVMPEFVGGMDSLYSFILANIKYPDWEKQNKIEGTVYVSFIVNEEGIVTKPEIERSVPGSKNFDKEVLRVVSLMPKWIPASEKGKNVSIQYFLPMRFKLKDS